ncbi:MAG TPA: hypothetical protein VFV01_11075 [Spirillospora sp.]|nr:hypothetical protein [Spirillospora sp.]
MAGTSVAGRSHAWRRWWLVAWKAQSQSDERHFAVFVERHAEESAMALWRQGKEQLGILEEQYFHAQHVLPGRERRTCLALIENSIRTAAALIRADAAGEGALSTMLKKNIKNVHNFIAERQERVARRSYIWGLYSGAALSALLLFLVGWVGVPAVGRLVVSDDSLSTGAFLAFRDALVCVAGGAVGAVISMLIRLRKVGRIDPMTATRAAAAQRIYLGWLFAIALFFLIKGGIVSVFADPTQDITSERVPAGQVAAVTIKSFFFWGGLGILAGFNERWVPAMIIKDSEKPDESVQDKAPNKDGESTSSPKTDV